MIPLGDESRRLSRFPIATVLIVALNVFAFILELSKGERFVERWSAVPADIVAGRHLDTLVTAMFLHASWSHIIGNMVFLWAFGPQIEDAMSPLRYAAFYLVGGMVAMLGQIFADAHSTIPNLGASGAIAAVMGAFIVSYPRDRIRTLLFFGWYIRVTLVPAVFLIGFWFLTQLVSIGTVTEADSGGVAYLAHITGFVFGVVAIRLFEMRSRGPRPRD